MKCVTLRPGGTYWLLRHLDAPTISSCCSFCYSFPVLVHQQIHFSRVVIVLYIPFCILFGLIVLEAIPTLQSAIQHQTFPTLRPRMGQLSMQKSLSCSIRRLAPAHLNLHLGPLLTPRFQTSTHSRTDIHRPRPRHSKPLLWSCRCPAGASLAGQARLDHC